MGVTGDQIHGLAEERLQADLEMYVVHLVSEGQLLEARWHTFEYQYPDLHDGDYATLVSMRFAFFAGADAFYELVRPIFQDDPAPQSLMDLANMQAELGRFAEELGFVQT